MHPVGVVGPRVAAVLAEHAKLVAQQAATKRATVNHQARVAAGGQESGNAGPIHEVQFRGARILVEAERELEFAALHLSEAELLVVHIDVAPGIVLVPHLTLDLIVGDVENLAVDPDTPARQISERAATDLASVLKLNRGILKVLLEAQTEIDARARAQTKGRTVGPAEAPVVFDRLRFRLLAFFLAFLLARGDTPLPTLVGGLLRLGLRRLFGFFALDLRGRCRRHDILSPGRT